MKTKMPEPEGRMYDEDCGEDLLTGQFTESQLRSAMVAAYEEGKQEMLADRATAERNENAAMIQIERDESLLRECFEWIYAVYPAKEITDRLKVRLGL